MGLTCCGFSCLNNSGCLGLSGLNLTDIGGGGGALVGFGGLVLVAGGCLHLRRGSPGTSGLGAGIGGGLSLGSHEVGLVLG